MCLASTTAREQPAILLVDDDEQSTALRSLILMQAGYAVQIASSAGAALDLSLTNSYDIIVSDFEMAAMNGLQFAAELRRRQCNVPFVLLSGRADLDVIAGDFVDAYVWKGSAPDQLIHTLNCLLRDAARNQSKSLPQNTSVSMKLW